MELTIEQYIQQIYTIRSDLDETIKHNIEIIHAEIVDRIAFEIPLYHVNSFNVNSCIVSLDNGKQYYHIIDHSTFNFFVQFLDAFEWKQPHLASAIYAKLRHDTCVVQHDEAKAEKYKEIPIFFTQYDMEVEKKRERDPIDLTNRFAFMARFYFLHEYGHFLIANPIRKNVDFGFVDCLVNLFTDNMINNAKSLSKKQAGNELKDILQIDKILNYQMEYRSNKHFREEIICDIQSVFVLLEWADDHDVKLIFESILAFVYTQYFVWLSKSFNDDDMKLGNMFHYRINILFQFAYMLENEDFVSIMCNILHSNNRFFKLTDIRCEPLDLDKLRNFYTAYTDIMELDLQNKLASYGYMGDFGGDKFDITNMVPHTCYELSKNADGIYIPTELYTPKFRKKQLEELHNNALKEAGLIGGEYIDYISLNGGGITMEEIKNYNKRMYKYIRKSYPSFFDTYPWLISKATTTTLSIWEKEGRIMI